MIELNAGQKRLVYDGGHTYRRSYIDDYRNLLKSIAKEKKNYFDTLENYRFNQDFWDIYQSKEEWVNRWLKVVSQEEREWIARNFVSALYDSNAPKQVIAVVKKANAVLSDLTDYEGFEKCRKNRKFSDKQNDILHKADCVLLKWETEISKDVPSDKAKNKTDSSVPAGEQNERQVTIKLPPLSERDRAALDIIESLPPNTGIQETKLVERLEKEKKIYISGDTFRKSIYPALRPYGVKNQRKGKVGYYKSQQ